MFDNGYQQRTFNGRAPEDAGLGVEFFVDAVEDEVQTAELGRPCYKEVEMVRIRIPAGEWAPTGELHTKRVSKTYIDRFPQEYANFKAARKDVSVGTPLKMWPAIGPGDLREITSLGILTVEALANISDRELRTYEFLVPFVQKAQNWLDALNSGETLLKLQARITDLEKALHAEELKNEQLLDELATRPKRKAAKEEVPE